VTGIEPPLDGLAGRGVLVALAGVLAAFVVACLAEAVRTGARCWPGVSWPRRLSWTLLLLLPLLAWTAWRATLPARWEPAVVISARPEANSDVDPVRRVEQQHKVKCLQVVGSADGRYLAAILNGSQELLILESATVGAATKLATDNGEWFGDLTFHPNSRVLAAIVYSDATSAKLVRWDAPDWIPREPVLLDGLFGRSNHSDGTSLALDQLLLAVSYHCVGERRAEVTIFKLDVLQDRFEPKTSVSETIDLQLPRRGGLWTAPWIDWLVSPRGTWIASTGSWIGAVQDHVFCENGTPVTLAGRAIAFSPHGEHLLVYERSDRLVWKKQQTTTSAPPFWNHLRTGGRYRVAIFDCRKRKAVACSRWFARLSHPRITPDRTRFLANHEDSILVWQIFDFVR